MSAQNVPMTWRVRGPESLSARLTFLVVALAFPMLLVIALTYADVLRERRRAETASATQAARNGAAIVEGFLRDLESTTFATAGLLGDPSRTIDQAAWSSKLPPGRSKPGTSWRAPACMPIVLRV